MTDSTRALRIRQALADAFPDGVITVTDDSARHAGHAGARPEGETHFTIRVVSQSFAHLSRVGRSRMVHQLLQREFDRGLHAVSLELRSSEESF